MKWLQWVQGRARLIIKTSATVQKVIIIPYYLRTKPEKWRMLKLDIAHSHTIVLLILTTIQWGRQGRYCIINPILQIRKLWLKEVKGLSHGHLANKWQNSRTVVQASSPCSVILLSHHAASLLSTRGGKRGSLDGLEGWDIKEDREMGKEHDHGLGDRELERMTYWNGIYIRRKWEMGFDREMK